MTGAEQYRTMAFAQLTCRESLGDIEVCLGAQAGKLYHMGFSQASEAIDAGRGQRISRLADLRRFRPASDCSSVRSLPQG